MKQIKMNVVEVESEGRDSETCYVKIGTDYRAGWGLPAHHMIISERVGNVPTVERGDRVSAEVMRGTSENEAGIIWGGEWEEKTGVVVETWGGITGPQCDVKFDDGDTQVMSAIIGINGGYPGRNLQLTGEPVPAYPAGYKPNMEGWEK